MRLTYSPSLKGHRGNPQSPISSPPARSSSQTPNRVPLQSALKAIQSHHPSRSIELAFEVGDVFQVKGDYVGPDGSVWLDVTSPASGLRGIVPFHKLRIISLPHHSAHEHPCRPQPTPQSLPFPQSDEKFLHSRSLQRIRKRLSAHTPANQPSKSPPQALEENTPPGASPVPATDLYQLSADPPPARGRRSFTLSSSKPTNSSGPIALSRMRVLSQACQANVPSNKKAPPHLKPSRQPNSPAPLQCPGQLKVPIQLNPPAHRNIPVQHSPPAQPNPPAQGRSPQLLCGVVKHSFTAETDHELDAHAGEPIIINAYSDLGWFVCKPISRLGGPGLLPVSHVGIRDVSTGMEVLPANIEHFVCAAGLPRLNEWEEAAAAYLYRSIPLGTFDVPAAVQKPPHALPTVTLSEPFKSVFTDTPPMPFDTKVKASSELVREWQRRQMEEHTLLVGLATPQRDSVDQLRASATFIWGTAVSLAEAQGQFWFTLQVKLACGNDLRALVLHRSYEDFLKFDRSFQSQLRITSEAAAEELRMPWLMEHVSANCMTDQRLCAYQVDELTYYLEQLSRASIEIRGLGVLCEFLAPRQGDVELEPNVLGTTMGEIYENDIIQYMDQMVGASPKDDLHEKLAKSSLSASQTASADQSIPSSMFDNSILHHHCSDGDPSLDHSSSTLYSSFPSAKLPPCSSPLTKSAAKSYYNSDGQFTKIKICDLQSDDCIAMKVSSSVLLNELTAKIRNRLNETLWLSGDPDDDYFGVRPICLKYITLDSLDQSCIDFDDCDSLAEETEALPPHLGRGKFVKVKSDAQLLEWMATGQKLVLYI